MFDLLHRSYGYPLEYVLEALAPTTERDFTLLPPPASRSELDADECFAVLVRELPSWDYDDVRGLLARFEERAAADALRPHALRVLTLLLDRRLASGALKRSVLAGLVEANLGRVADCVRAAPGAAYAWAGSGSLALEPASSAQVLVLDARGFPPEGPDSLARALVTLRDRGFRRLLVVRARGQRFLGAGLATAF